MMTKYRIVIDEINGYEVQSWSWCWPFWVQAGGTNTHLSIERAEEYAHRTNELRRKKRVVKYLGQLS